MSYEGKVVTITQTDDGDYDDGLRCIDSLMCKFKMSSPGSTWGCDGIGYALEKERGIAFRHKGGVGPINYKKGLKAIKEM